MKLRNSLKPLDLSEEDIANVQAWYEDLHSNEIVFPQALAVSGDIGIRLSEKILVLLSLRKIFKPVTIPKINSKLLKTFETDGYEVILTEEILEEAQALGVNPREIKAVTGFKKCPFR